MITRKQIREYIQLMQSLYNDQERSDMYINTKYTIGLEWLNVTEEQVTNILTSDTKPPRQIGELTRVSADQVLTKYKTEDFINLSIVLGKSSLFHIKNSAYIYALIYLNPKYSYDERVEMLLEEKYLPPYHLYSGLTRIFGMFKNVCPQFFHGDSPKDDTEELDPYDLLANEEGEVLKQYQNLMDYNYTLIENNIYNSITDLHNSKAFIYLQMVNTQIRNNGKLSTARRNNRQSITESN